MRIPQYPRCNKCEKWQTEPIGLTGTSLRWKCSCCGAENTDIHSLPLTVGVKLLLRSLWEYNEKKDYNISIVFSAMAVECELYHLFKKWSEIKFLNELEDKMRNFGNFNKKFKKVTKQLYSAGVVAFIKDTPELKQTVARYPGIGLNTFIKDVNEKLMWKRNNILHFGNFQYNRGNAGKCFSIAYLVISALVKMDEWKCQQEK